MQCLSAFQRLDEAILFIISNALLNTGICVSHSRLLFLLQCCIALSDQTLSKCSTNLPLTLGSTVKKFSKKILQGSATVRDVRKQVLNVCIELIRDVECMRLV